MVKAPPNKDHNFTLSNTLQDKHLEKVSQFKIFSYLSLMKELPSPKLKMLIPIISKHLETIIHEKCNLLKIWTSLQ